MFQQITVNTNKIYQLDFLKVIISQSTLRKQQSLDPFVDYPVHCLLSLKS